MNFDVSEFDHFSFDLWLTIIKSHPEYKPARNRLFKEFFEIEKLEKQVSETIRYYDVLCNKISETTGRHIYFAEIYLLILSALGKDLDQISQQRLDEFYSETKFLFEKFPPLLISEKISDLFEKITSENKTISILSNTAFIQGTELRNLLDYYNLSKYISFGLYSDETGLSKPNPKLFELMKESARKVNPRENLRILHIGDNPKADFQGAVNSGINAYLFQPNKN